MSKNTNRLKFPENGKKWCTIESELNSIQLNDIDWKKGRSPLYVFKGNVTNIVGEKAFIIIIML